MSERERESEIEREANVVVWCGVVWYGVVWCGMVWYAHTLYHADNTTVSLLLGIVQRSLTVLMVTPTPHYMLQQHSIDRQAHR